MYHSDPTGRRGTRRRRATWLLAVVTLAVAAVSCTRPAPDPPQAETPPATAPGQVTIPPTTRFCPMPVEPDGGPGGPTDVVPIRPCIPRCPVYVPPVDGPAPVRPCPPPPCRVAPAPAPAPGDGLTVPPARPCPPCPRPSPSPSPSDGAGTPATVPPAVEPRPCDPPVPGTGIPGLIGTRDFAAWINAMPGPGARRPLIVTGTLVFATAGYSAKLVPASPQGINPKILILDLVVDPPDGPVAQVITDVPVRYEQPGADYDQVTIPKLGLNLEVGIAH